MKSSRELSARQRPLNERLRYRFIVAYVAVQHRCPDEQRSVLGPGSRGPCSGILVRSTRCSGAAGRRSSQPDAPMCRPFGQFVGQESSSSPRRVIQGCTRWDAPGLLPSAGRVRTGACAPSPTRRRGSGMRWSCLVRPCSSGTACRSVCSPGLRLSRTGLVDATTAVSGFGDPVVDSIACLFVLAAGLESAGVTAWAGRVSSQRLGPRSAAGGRHGPVGAARRGPHPQRRGGALCRSRYRRSN